MPDIHKGEAECYEANRSLPYWGTRGGARGTQGYVAVSVNNTFTANKVGKVLTSNMNPDIPGVVELGALMGNNVPVNGPPTEAKPLSPGTMKNIGNLVMGLMDTTSGGGQSGGGSMIDVQGSEEDGGQEDSGQDAGFTEGFFAPDNNPFPDGPDGGEFMTSCNN